MKTIHFTVPPTLVRGWCIAAVLCMIGFPGNSRIRAGVPDEQVQAVEGRATVETIVVEDDVQAVEVLNRVVAVVQDDAQPAAVVGAVEDLQPPAEPKPADKPVEEADSTTKLREKLKTVVNVRLNKVTLKAALESLGKEHGFEFRFDPEALKATGVDPEKVQVAMNVRRRGLAAVLREILGEHDLRFALEKEVVVIVARPKQPTDIKRRRGSDNGPAEQVVLGGIVVSDKKDEAKAAVAAERNAAVAVPAMRLGGVRMNPEAAKKLKEQQIAQFRQQYLGLLRNELTLCFNSLPDATPEQKKELVAAARKAFEATGDKWSDVQIGMRQGWNGQPPQQPNVRDEIQAGLLVRVEELFPGEKSEMYRSEAIARREHKKKATISNLAQMLDRHVLLSRDQRIAITEKLNEHWKPQWGNALEYMQWEGNNVFPNMDNNVFRDLLTKEQLSVWNSVSKMDPSQFWGGGGGFNFFTPQPDLEDLNALGLGDLAKGNVPVEGIIGGAIQVVGDAIAVEQAVEGAVEVIVKPVEEKPVQPAEDNPKDEAKPQ